MKGQDSIDDLFKDALSGRTVSASPDEAWKGASSLLDQHFRKAMVLRWVIGISASMALLIAGIAFYFAPTSSDRSTQSLSADSVAVEENAMLPAGTEQQISPNAAASPAIKAIANQGTFTESVNQQESLEEPIDQAARADRQTAPQNDALNTATDAFSTRGTDATQPALTLSEQAIAEQRTSTIEPTKDNAPVLQSFIAQGDESNNFTADRSLDAMPAFEVNALALHTDGVLDRDPLEKEALIGELRKVEVLLEGGALLATPFENTSSRGKEGVAKGVIGGVAVQYHFHSKLFARTGALVHTRDALNSTSIDGETFGGSIEAAALRINYIDIPIEVGYRSQRHSLYFGLLFSPLIGTRTAIQLVPNNSDGTGSPEVLDYEQRRTGFASFDVAGSAGYRYQISHRLSAFSSIRFGLFDITDNAHFGTAVIDDRNHQLRLGLSYRLLNL